jgi:hypothetical protein
MEHVHIGHIFLAFKVAVALFVVVVRWRMNKGTKSLHETIHRVYEPQEARERMKFYSVWLGGWYGFPVICERCEGPLQFDRKLQPFCPRCALDTQR